jgi:hypothetical protein
MASRLGRWTKEHRNIYDAMIMTSTTTSTTNRRRIITLMMPSRRSIQVLRSKRKIETSTSAILHF